MHNRINNIIRTGYFGKSFLLFISFNLLQVICVYAQIDFENKIRITREISFENLQDEITTINLDKRGNFICTYLKSANVNVYDNNGNLLINYGRKGKGPADFLHPLSTIRLTSGKLTTIEFQGKISIFNANGDSLIKVHNMKILPLWEVHQIDKNRILLVGRKRIDNQIKLLHIFDLSKESIIKSFLELPFSLQDYGGVFHSIARVATADVKGGNIVAMISTKPKIELFDNNGDFIQSIDVKANNFKKIKKVKKKLTRREIDKYITSFSLVSNIFWLNNENFLINYFQTTEFESRNNFTQQYSLAYVHANGNIQFDLSNTPKLTSIRNDKLYFEDSNFQDEVNLLMGIIEY